MKRLAYVGPTPTDSPAGVPGMARELLQALSDLGCRVDCFFAGTHVEMPPSLRDTPGLSVVSASTRWRWDAWYSRHPLAAFITGQGVRALGFQRLGSEIQRRHAELPYDAIYQFSQIEMFGLSSRLKSLPPVIIHPEVHIGGELRALWRERRISYRTSGLPVFAAVLLMLVVRSAVQRRHLKQAHAVVCPSRAFAEALLRDASFLRDRVDVVPNVIDTDLYTAVARPPLGPQRVVFVGRISLRKGVPDVVRLAHDLPPDVHLDIYGGHSLWSDYRSLLAGLPTNASYHGGVGAEEVRAAMAQGDVLVQPSTYEPFGLTVAEGAASGARVVAYEAVGAAEDLPPGTAWRVPTGAYPLLLGAVLEALAGGAGPEEVRRSAVELFGRVAFRRHLTRVLSSL